MRVDSSILSRSIKLKPREFESSRDQEVNDLSVKTGQIYQRSDGDYFVVENVSGGFAIICCHGERRTVLRNTFKSNIEEGQLKLITDDIEKLKILLLGELMHS